MRWTTLDPDGTVREIPSDHLQVVMVEWSMMDAIEQFLTNLDYAKREGII